MELYIILYYTYDSLCILYNKINGRFNYIFIEATNYDLYEFYSNL